MRNERSTEWAEKQMMFKKQVLLAKTRFLPILGDTALIRLKPYCITSTLALVYYIFGFS